jgi:LmbE family N-acetylglucosaminyl deacetylase
VLKFSLPSHLDVICLGAHPDDIEIGCGGTLMALAETGLSLTNVVLTGSPARAAEASNAATAIRSDAKVVQRDLPDGRLPAAYSDVKEILEDVARDTRADLVLAPRPDDAHQDHRMLGTLASTVWRDHLLLHYEIPKWDGNLGPVTHYVPLSSEQARSKVRLLDASYPSQRSREWWDEETFLGLMRLRGVECRSRFAEGFVAAKTVLRIGRT